MNSSSALQWSRTRLAIRWAMIVLYVAAGILHLYIPAPFLQITPRWVPFPEAVVVLTGIVEMLGAIGLMLHSTRKAAGIGLALYSVCVFPANINHAMQDLTSADEGLGWWYHAPRLAVQPVLVWAALFCSSAMTGAVSKS